MKKLVFLFAVLFAAELVWAQNFAINMDGNPADVSALLDVRNSTKGVLIPV